MIRERNYLKSYVSLSISGFDQCLVIENLSSSNPTINERKKTHKSRGIGKDFEKETIIWWRKGFLFFSFFFFFLWRTNKNRGFCTQLKKKKIFFGSFRKSIKKWEVVKEHKFCKCLFFFLISTIEVNLIPKPVLIWSVCLVRISISRSFSH